MPDVFGRAADADIALVIYAGRFVDQVAGGELPKGCIVLGEQHALSQKLARVLDRASLLVVLDLPSFPLEAIAGDHWDVPMVVLLPSGFDAESLIATFGTAFFARLGFYDYVVTPNSAVWERMRRKYCWAESQRLMVASDHPSEVARAVCTLFKAGFASPAIPDHNQPGVGRSWHERNYKLASSVSDKALHQLQAAALEPWFSTLQERHDAEVPLDVLEVGTGVGRWASSFDLAQTRFTGIDVREDLLEIARANFSEGRFEHLSSDLLFPYDDQSFDLVFSVTAMRHNPALAKRILLSQMWRVTRSGGRLLFLEDFAFPKQLEEPSIHPISVTEFMHLIVEAMAGQVLLEHVESLQYPGEDLRRGGLVSLLRLGILERCPKQLSQRRYRECSAE